MIVCFVTSIFGCPEGYYNYNKGCMPCDSSCKTCSDESTCESCETFMKFDDTTLLCTHCFEDEYFDPTLRICRNCMDTCEGHCNSRSECTTCSVGESLDLDTLTCVTDCQSSQIKLEGHHLSVQSACRTPYYYVDPLSTEVLELGTLHYPYRTMKSVSSEVLTFLSHQEVSITAYVKDVYIEDKSLFIMNVTQFAIQSHPDLVKTNTKAVVTPTELPQIGISKKSKFHLLQSVELPLDDIISAGEFSSNEKLQIEGKTSNMVVRSGIKFEGVDFYREEIDYNKDVLFMLGVYLQNNTASFSNMMINITGTLWTTYDPSNIYARNLVFDTYSIRKVFSFLVTCNYPEANKIATLDVDGFKIITSKDRTTESEPSNLSSNLPGNWIIKNFDGRDAYTAMNDLHSTIIYATQSFCIPDDDLVQKINLENLYLSLNNTRGDKANLIGMDVSASHYRPIIANLRNANFYGYQKTLLFPTAFIGTLIDVVEIDSYSLTNCSLWSYGLLIIAFKTVTIGNLLEQPTEFSNIESFASNYASISFVGQLELRNVHLKNITGLIGQSLYFISLNSFPSTSVVIQNLEVDDFTFSQGGIIQVTTSTNRFEMSNVIIQNSQTYSEIPIFNFNEIGSFGFTNFTIRNISVNEKTDEDSVIFKINALNLNSITNSSLQNFDVSECAISLLQFGSLTNNNNSEAIHLEMKNITFRDSVVTSPRPVISTENLVHKSSFFVKISSFSCSNITFNIAGNILLLFSHGLINPVIVEDSIFTNLNSASISAITSGQEESLVNEVTFINCSFSNISTTSQSLITTSNKAVFNFVGSKFESISVLFDRSGIIDATSNSIIKITSSNFTHNSAITSTLFAISFGAYVECNSCIIANNFAIKNGVVSASNNGYFKFYDSDIFSNIALQTPIGQIFDASQASVFDNCKIHGNSVMTLEEIKQEIQEECGMLCFIPDSFIDIVITNEEDSIIAGPYIIEAVSGSLEIINQTLIYDQDAILNLLMTICKITNSIFQDINFTITPIRATSSTLECYDMNLTNIQDYAEREIMLINGESKFIASNVAYNNSNAKFIKALAGEASLTNFVARNVSKFSTLFQFYSLDALSLSNVTFLELEINSGQVILIENAQNIYVDTLVINGIHTATVSVMNSVVESINNIQISSCLKSIIVIDSHIKQLENSNFTNNGIQNNLVSGGAISMFNSDVTIRNTTFSNNTADRAGAISFECDSADKCSLVLESTTFNNNSAFVQGGAIYYSLKRPDIVDSMFTDNSARYGDNLASYPVKVRIEGQSDSYIKFTDVGSGITMPSSLVFALLDYDNQVVSLNSEDTFGIFAPAGSNATVKGVNSVNFNAGIATIEGIMFVDQPGSKNVKFDSSTAAIDKGRVSLAFPDQDFNNDITVDFRFCQPGEEATDQGTCRECDAGTYSLEWNSTECIKCMDNALCLGRNQVSVNPGYWRSSQTSEFITECLVKESCEGGFTNSTLHPVNCAEGYQGVLCSHCLVNEEVKYRKVSNAKCDKCPDIIANTFLVVGLASLVFAFIMILIVINIRKTKESQLSVLIRIMTNYFQLIFTSLSLTTNYPTSLVTFFEISEMFGNASDTFLSVDCFIRDYDVEGAFGSNAVFKLFLLVLLPLILFALVALIWIVAFFLKRKYVPDLKRNLIISFISILFLLHPKLTEQSLGLFRCIDVNIDDGRVRLDTNIKCYSGEHIKWLLLISGPCIIVWVVSLPLTALVILFYNSKKQEDNRIKQYFLILYQGLKKDKFYWEFVNTARKILILVIFPLPTLIKMMVAIMILTILARLQIKLQPYNDAENNKIEILATSAGIITIFSGLLYSQPDEMKVLNTVALLFCICINTHFIINWMYLLVKLFRDSSKVFQVIYKLISFVLCKRVSKEPLDSKEMLKDLTQHRNKPKKYRNHKRRVNLKAHNRLKKKKRQQ
ncbi:unnamed protein product [Moneuplotes crassus]|uniref:Uncharacterized protein n=1 Tax=Euplotes crassus TaxID=5936 RepID=A0AAD1XLC7_EUPCR|nr:unnamed protein product [Moneuplotes crassus]